MLTNPIDGHVKTGYSYPIKTELCQRGAEKGNGEYLCQGHRNGQRILEE